MTAHPMLWNIFGYADNYVLIIDFPVFHSVNCYLCVIFKIIKASLYIPFAVALVATQSTGHQNTKDNR